MPEDRGVRLPDLGDRGQGWVVLQLAVLGAIPLVGVLSPGWPDALATPMIVVGAVTGVLGGVISVAGVAGLGRSLSVFPEPGPSAELVTSGMYGRARHPIYGGLILVGLGIALALSAWAVPVAALLALVLDGKSRVEERRLMGHFPPYAEYRSRVPHRFFPV